MIILGIETSCDETAAAVVKDGRKILSSVVASSEELHKESRGIIPEVAAREQIRCIVPVVQQATQNSKLKTQNLDAIAVTVGPGLVGSLLVGVETVKTLAYVFRKPIVPVNHLQAHLYTNFICGRPNFPAIGLVVSGGHTDLVLMENHGKIKWVGGTRDDAAGECFDKCARILGLSYPGGPEIAAAAKKFKVKNSPASPRRSRGRAKFKIKLPRPMLKTKDFDFSFSGLKTSVLRQAQDKFSENERKSLAFEIQEAVTDVLVEKTILAAAKYKVKSILLAGGVAANQRLREKMKLRIKNYEFTPESGQVRINFFVPPKALCTDNAVFVAVYAFYNYKPIRWQKLKVNPSLKIEEIV